MRIAERAGTTAAMDAATNFPAMKKLLTLSSLLIVGGYAAVELARDAGVRLPAAFTPVNALIAFTLVSLSLIALADYGPKSRAIAVRAPARREGPKRLHSIAAAHHHVHAIRRGAEAARLASISPAVVCFPRRRSVRLQRAA